MTYLFLAYSVFWLLLAGYIAMLAARQRRLAEELDDLAAALERDRARQTG